MGHDQRPLLGAQPATLLEDAFRNIEPAQVLEQRRVPDAPLSSRVEAQIIGEALGQLGVLSSSTVHRLAELDGGGEGEYSGLLDLP